MIQQINFHQFANAADFLPPDSGVECATLWDDGAQLWSVVGGQVSGWTDRERIWVYDRLTGGPHESLNYSGYWAGEAAPAGAIASRLNVAGIAPESTPQGWPLYHVANVDFTLNWEARARGGDAPQTWRVEIRDALTGAMLNAVSVVGQNSNVHLTAAPTRLIIRVRAPQQPIGTYSWPPPNYQSISGEATDTPAQYRWVHPTLGEFYYDPRYRVGARPYDATDPIQAALLALETPDPIKVPQWVSLLKPFSASGEPLFGTGEDSLIRVVVGAGEWDENAVSDAARVPCVWRAPLNRATLAITAPYAAWTLPVASMRSVSALEIDDDGALLVGGAVNASNGPAPCLLQIQRSDIAGDEAAGVTTLSLFYCECVDDLGKAIHGIARTRKGLRAVSPCDGFSHDATRTLERRLVPSHPGGRNAITWRNALGEHYAFSTEAGDFGTNALYPDAHGFVILESASGQRTGAPLGKQLDSMLASLGGQLWGVWDEDPKCVDGVQHLGSSEVGDNWRIVASWNKTQFDGGVVCVIGNKSDGLALWCFGTRGDLTMQPRAFRVQGEDVARNVNSAYFVQRLQSVIVNGETLGVGVGLHWDAATGYSREQRLIYTRGDDATATTGDDGGGGNPTGDPVNADEALGVMPDGTRVSLVSLPEHGATLAETVAAVGLNLRLRHATIAAWEYEALYPAFWLRADAAAPLLIDEGATMTPAIKAQLATFDLRARELRDKFLPVEAQKRVELIVLLAPDWVLEDSALKATF